MFEDPTANTFQNQLGKGTTDKTNSKMDCLFRFFATNPTNYINIMGISKLFSLQNSQSNTRVMENAMRLLQVVFGWLREVSGSATNLNLRSERKLQRSSYKIHFTAATSFNCSGHGTIMIVKSSVECAKKRQPRTISCIVTVVNFLCNSKNR